MSFFTIFSPIIWWKIAVFIIILIFVFSLIIVQTIFIVSWLKQKQFIKNLHIIEKSITSACVPRLRRLYELSLVNLNYNEMYLYFSDKYLLLFENDFSRILKKMNQIESAMTKANILKTWKYQRELELMCVSFQSKLERLEAEMNSILVLDRQGRVILFEYLQIFKILKNSFYHLKLNTKIKINEPYLNNILKNFYKLLRKADQNLKKADYKSLNPELKHIANGLVILLETTNKWPYLYTLVYTVIPQHLALIEKKFTEKRTTDTAIYKKFDKLDLDVKKTLTSIKQNLVKLEYKTATKKVKEILRELYNFSKRVQDTSEIKTEFNTQFKLTRLIIEQLENGQSGIVNLNKTKNHNFLLKESQQEIINDAILKSRKSIYFFNKLLILVNNADEKNIPYWELSKALDKIIILTRSSIENLIRAEKIFSQQNDSEKFLSKLVNSCENILMELSTKISAPEYKNLASKYTQNVNDNLIKLEEIKSEITKNEKQKYVDLLIKYVTKFKADIVKLFNSFQAAVIMDSLTLGAIKMLRGLSLLNESLDQPLSNIEYLYEQGEILESLEKTVKELEKIKFNKQKK